MLPKPEKKPRVNNNPDQIDLVDTLDSVDKIDKKRKFLIFLILLTVGLSFVFWLYRTGASVIKSGDFSRFKPKISLPRLKTSTTFSPAPTRFDPQDIQKYLDKLNQSDSATWAAYVYSDPDLTFSYNNLTLSDTVTQDLLSSPSSSNTDLVTTLPLGLPIFQNLTVTDNSLSFQIIIAPPKKKILIVTEITNSTDIEKSKNLIPPLVDFLYWQLIQAD